MDDSSSHHSSSHNSTTAFYPTAMAATETSEEDPMEKAKEVRKRLENQPKVLERWNTVNVFLKAVFGFALEDDWEMVDGLEEKKKDPLGGRICPSSGRKWRVLHAISSIKCHHSLFLLAAALHPEQSFEVDNNDLKRIDNIYKSKDLVENPTNLTALHFAASSRASDDGGKIVLTQLLGLNRGASECVDSEGSTPLHRIAENKYKPNWVADGASELYNANRNAVRAMDSNGRLPLHRAAGAMTYPKGLEDGVLMMRSKLCRLIQEYEDGAQQPDNFGCLPLHLVAQYGTIWDVQVQALYEANTSAVRARTGVKYGNSLPLHLAAANADTEFSMISKLLELNPRAASQADRKGRFPLHLACEAGLSWKSIEAIHEAYPEAILQAEQNSRAWRALHMAASAKNADDVLICNLALLDPTAASVPDSNGRYPLHLACISGKTWETGLSSLFDANPTAISTPDCKGLLPLHIVSLQCCEKPTQDRGPQVIDTRSRRLSKTAASLEADQPTLKEIEEAKKVGNLFNLLKAEPTVL
jgi:ankyrin repeat protein